MAMTPPLESSESVSWEAHRLLILQTLSDLKNGLEKVDQNVQKVFNEQMSFKIELVRTTTKEVTAQAMVEAKKATFRASIIPIATCLLAVAVNIIIVLVSR